MKLQTKAELYRKLPSVDELQRSRHLAELASKEGQASVTDAARAVLASLREEIAEGRLDTNGIEVALTGLEAAVSRRVRQTLTYSLRPVINATGVILHTNLGRAPISPSALVHAREIAESYSNLELNLETGERGKRDVHVNRLFQKLLDNDPVDVGAHAGAAEPTISTIVVNNNAAAVLLALNTLAENGEVIVSRGELVEIGGSFRIPDVMSKSNAVLREVGTTNRTRVADYEKAVNERTRLLLRVHRSNFEITGFTEQPPLAELVRLAHQRGLPLMEDLGSGALVDLHNFGLREES